MNVGLPGTGIGGLFYLLSAFFILANEIYLIAKGRSSKKRWRVVQEQAAIAVSMILIAIASNYVLGKYLFKKASLPQSTSNSLLDDIVVSYQIHPILVPITILVIVICTTQLLAVGLQQRKHVSR